MESPGGANGGIHVTDPRKFVTAEIIIASALSISTIIQLIMSKTFGSPQVFMVILLLGGC